MNDITNEDINNCLNKYYKKQSTCQRIPDIIMKRKKSGIYCLVHGKKEQKKHII